MSSIRKCRILSINNLDSVLNSTIPKPLLFFLESEFQGKIRDKRSRSFGIGEIVSFQVNSICLKTESDIK